MAVSQQEEMLTFDDFRREVNASESAVRDAVKKLGLQPQRVYTDLRFSYYRREWVAQVRDYLDKRARGEA